MNPMRWFNVGLVFGWGVSPLPVEVVPCGDGAEPVSRSVKKESNSSWGEFEEIP